MKGERDPTYGVLRVPDVRRIELGWGASVIGELAGQVTLVVYAFDAGGAVLVAAHAASRTVVSMVATLGVAGVSGRVRPGVLLRRVTWLRAVLLALAAVTAARTATVVADEPLRTLALDRESFLVAVAANTGSRAAADALAAERLAADPVGEQIGSDAGQDAG